MNKSLWVETVTLPKFKSLERDENTDVLVIGGGMAGILCAKFLSDAGIDYILCESDRIGSGTTSRTTAVISAQHDTLYIDMIKKFGVKKAKMYLKSNLNAVSKYREICRNIDCDFEDKPSYMYSRTNANTLMDEVKAVNALGFQAKLVTSLPLPEKITTAVKYPDQAQFHPLKFISEISKNLNIREKTQIKKIDNTTAYTDKFKIKANKIIVASHFPIMNTHGLYFAKLYQMRSYVIALENAAQYDGTFVGNGEGDLYFRNYKNLLLVGGGDHRTGKNGGGYNMLRSFAKRNFPEAKEKYAWATQDCMSLDGVPYIGRYSQSTENVFVISGFNEWGMTSSMVAAEILTDMIMGRKNKFAEVYDPSRSMLNSQLFANIGVTLADFVIPSTKRCPHLGCTLKWNPAEHSWDCPCHGSRFDDKGHLINNPATGDLKL